MQGKFYHLEYFYQESPFTIKHVAFMIENIDIILIQIHNFKEIYNILNKYKEKITFTKNFNLNYSLISFITNKTNKIFLYYFFTL